MADLGTDIDCVEDFKLDMPVVSGRLALAQALIRRLITPAGRFAWLDADGVTVRGWPNYGTDLRGFLLSKASPSTIARATEAECLKDERVDVATPTVSMLDATTVTLQLAITTAEGDEFTFTMSVDQARVTLLELQEAA